MKVKVYSTPTCPWCLKTKEFLKANKVSFIDADVGTDKVAAEEMISKSGQMGVPVIDIDGKIIVGFNETELKSSLNLK